MAEMKEHVGNPASTSVSLSCNSGAKRRCDAYVQCGHGQYPVRHLQAVLQNNADRRAFRSTARFIAQQEKGFVTTITELVPNVRINASSTFILNPKMVLEKERRKREKFEEEQKME